MKKNKSQILSLTVDTIKQHRLLSCGLLFSVAGAIVLGILPPLVLEKIVNQLVTDKNIAFRAALIYFLLLASAGLFDAAKESLITVFGQKVTHHIRSRLSEKLSTLPAAYFAENEPGVTVSRFVNDVDTVENLFTSGIISMVVDACKVISILVVIFVKSKGLGLLLLLVTPALFVMTRVFQKRMLGAQIANRVAVGKGNNHIPETIRSIRMIHSFRKERYMEEKYDDYIKESYRQVEKSNFYDAIYSPIIVTASAVLVAVMMVLSAKGGQMQSFFGMSVGTAVAVISYVGKVFEPLENIGMEIQNIQSAIAGIWRINEFLAEEERSMPENTKKEPFPSERCAAVELRNVSFGYEEGQTILKNYSFSIQPGENVTLTGRTGAGKSTIFKLLLGMYRPEMGTVTIFGREAGQIPDAEKRKLIGYVEQSFHMIQGTVEDQITLKDPSISRKAVERAMQMAGMDETVKALEKGYETPCTIQLFSQGQMQLLSIARAVAADPSILLLDEITANLDSATEVHVLHALKQASMNRTVLSISHRLYEKSGGRKICLDGSEVAD